MTIPEEEKKTKENLASEAILTQSSTASHFETDNSCNCPQEQNELSSCLSEGKGQERRDTSEDDLQSWRILEKCNELTTFNRIGFKKRNDKGMVRNGLCSQPEDISHMSRGRRWLIFIIGVVETMLWSGTIFGWASLVHTLKTNGVYNDLCQYPVTPHNTTIPPSVHSFSVHKDDLVPHTNSTAYDLLGDKVTIHSNGEEIIDAYKQMRVNCPEQDSQFALVYTVTCVMYSTPSILIGMALHHIGLASVRIVGGLMVSGGFFLLSVTTAENSHFLWGASLLLSMGGNTMRLAGLQLGNLFPHKRTMAMALISGIFTPSASVFLILQYASDAGIVWEHICWSLAAVSALTILLTPLFPKHHVPYTTTGNDVKEVDDTKKKKSSGPVTKSLFSLTSLLHVFWVFSNLFSIVLYGTNFNSWINQFAKDEEEVTHFSVMYGYANIACLAMTPLPGMLTTSVTNRMVKGKTGIGRDIAEIQAMIVPMLLVILTVSIQFATLLFHSSYAVYIGLVCLAINRPSCLAVGNPFIRVRFPADHFNQIIGAQGSLIAVLTLLQYPHFTWAQSQYYVAMGTTVGIIGLTVVHPLHLLNKSYLRRNLEANRSLSSEDDLPKVAVKCADSAISFPTE